MTVHTRWSFTKCFACQAKWESHNVPRLPRNMHVDITCSSPDSAIRKSTQHYTTRLKCCACHAKRRWQSPKWYAATKNAIRLSKPRKGIAPATQKDFRHVMNHVGTSQSAKLQKWQLLHTFAELARGTAILHDGRSRTVADTCARLRTQKQRQANTSQPPNPQSKTSTLRYVFWEKNGKNIIPKTILGTHEIAWKAAGRGGIWFCERLSNQ